MKILKTTFAAAVAAAAFSAPALADDVAFQLPDACTAQLPMDDTDHSGTDHGGMKGDQAGQMEPGMMGMDPDAMPEHVRENMRKMMISMPAMHKGMVNEDPDLAFVCGMIAHHQGAIDMAEVLLAHGADPQMRALAEEIIEAQVAEIDLMKTWLAENAD
jgi:uncharacterized protein (DUF305 family)